MNDSDVFHWRGLEFRPIDDSCDYWESGRWSVLRERGARSMVWRATWRYSPEKWESAFNPTRPWDRLASLDALIPALVRRTVRYAPDILELERKIIFLQQEHRELLLDIAQRGTEDGREEESSEAALQHREVEGDRPALTLRGWSDLPHGSGERGSTPTSAHQDPQDSEGLID